MDKRPKKRSNANPDTRESKTSKIEEKIFAGPSELSFNILPTGVQSSRKKLLESHIRTHGGIIREKLENTGVDFLIVDDNIDQNHLKTTISSYKSVVIGTVISLSWLSECLKQLKFVDPEKYIIQVDLDESADEDVEKEEAGTSSKKMQEELSSSGTSEEEEDGIKLISFGCAHASPSRAESKITNPNKLIMDYFQELADIYRNKKDRWRAFAYEKAIAAIKKYNKKIETKEEAKSIPGVGAKLADKIVEIIESGKLRKLEAESKDEITIALQIFTKIWGVGPSKAQDWVTQGFRTLEDIEKKAKLTHQQKIGLKLYDDLNDRMPRAEAEEIANKVHEAALGINPKLISVACGSYRRKKPTCGDVDVLLSNPLGEFEPEILQNVVEKLKGSGFLTDDLIVLQQNGTHRKYMGVCRLPEENRKHRRIDIILVPHEELACSMLYFTGSAHFNRSMRLLARKKGLSLSEHGLTVRPSDKKKGKQEVGNKLTTPTEESVFKHLGLEYRSPEDRDL